MKSIGRFNYPTDGRRVMAVLIPNPEKKTYDAMVVDPEKIGLAKVKRTRRMVFFNPISGGALFSGGVDRYHMEPRSYSGCSVVDRLIDESIGKRKR